jgi:hypothetical protein
VAETHRRYTKRQKVTAVLAADMTSVQAAAESTGIPRTTLIHWMDDPEMVELRQKTREQLAEAKYTAFLKRENALNKDIYVRPSGTNANQFVLVDDVKSDGIKALTEAGLEPALVTETSSNNFQVWIRFPSQHISNDERLWLGRETCKIAKGDPASVGRDHYGRLAGFTNRKPARKLSNGYQPYVLVRQALSKIASKAAEWLAKIRVMIQGDHNYQKEKKRVAQLKQVALKARNILNNHRGKIGCPEIFAIRYNDFMASDHYANQDGRPDLSRLDFDVVADLLRSGYSDTQVENALRTLSPNVDTWRADLSDYSKRTVGNVRRKNDKDQLRLKAVAFHVVPKLSIGKLV